MGAILSKGACMRQWFLALLIVAATSPAHAGASGVFAEDVLTIDMRRLPFMHLKDPQNAFQDTVKVRPARIHVNGGIPLKMGWTELFIGADYEILPFTYDGWDFTQETFRVDSLQSLSLDLRLRQKFSDDLAVRVHTMPGVFSDFHDVTSRSARLQGGVALEKTFLGIFTVGAGVESTTAFGTRKVVPMLTAQMKSRYFRAEGSLPTNMEVYFIPSDKFEVGIKGSVTGGNYRLEEGGAFKGNNVRYSVGTLGPSLNVKFSKHLTWSLDGGTTFLHSFSTFDSDTNVRDFDLKHAMYLMSGLKFGFGGRG